MCFVFRYRTRGFVCSLFFWIWSSNTYHVLSWNQRAIPRLDRFVIGKFVEGPGKRERTVQKYCRKHLVTYVHQSIRRLPGEILSLLKFSKFLKLSHFVMYTYRFNLRHTLSLIWDKDKIDYTESFILWRSAPRTLWISPFYSRCEENWWRWVITGNKYPRKQYFS